MPRRRRIKTKNSRRRDRAQFWIDHGEKVRLAFLGGGMVFMASVIASITR